MLSSCTSLWNVSRGKLCGLAASMSVTFIFAMVSMAQVPPLVTFFCRNCLTFPFFLSAAVCSNGAAIFSQIANSWKLLLLRSVIDSTAAGLFYTSVDFFPLTKLGFISQTQPVFSMFVAFFLLREKPSLFQVLCAIGAMCGAILVIQPPILGFPVPRENLHLSEISSVDEEDEKYLEMRLYAGVAVVVSGMFLFATGSCLMRRLSSSGQIHWAVVAFFQSGCGIVLSGIALVVLDKQMYLLHFCFLSQRLAVCALLLGSVLLQSSMFFCLKFEKSSMFSILLTSQVLFMAAADLCMLGTLPSLNGFHFIGFGLTLSSILALFVAKHVSVAQKQREDRLKEDDQANADLKSSEL